MATYLLTLINAPNGTSRIVGTGTLNLDQETRQYSLHLISQKITAKFYGSYSERNIGNFGVYALEPNHNKRGQALLEEGVFTKASINKIDVVEGFLAIVLGDGEVFSCLLIGGGKE